MSISSACFGLLQLSAIKGLGLKTFHHLHQELGSVQNILNADFDALKQLGLRVNICRAICDIHDKQISTGALENIVRWESESGQFLLCLEDEPYPKQLKEIYCPPPVLYIKGRLSAFNLPSIAIVGSRKSSVSGTQHAFIFARDLSLSGLCVNSGLALGIDAAAHQGALHSVGLTCAVLGTGLDVIYPKQHITLANQICEQGVLVSEMGLGVLPVPANFPRRNRIISGLSHGVLVVEASLKSGSLITANYALEQNREVYAIPGPIDSPVSSGCHALIKQGAQLVESIDDILADGLMDRAVQITRMERGEQLYKKEWLKANELKTQDLNKNEPNAQISQGSIEQDYLIKNPSDSEPEKVVMNYVDFQCISFDLLVHYTGLEVNKLTHILVGLELNGKLCSVPGGYQRCKAVNSPA